MALGCDFIVLIIRTKHLHLLLPHCLSAGLESSPENHGNAEAHAVVKVEGDHNVVTVVQHGSSSHVNSQIAAGRFLYFALFTNKRCDCFPPYGDSIKRQNASTKIRTRGTTFLWAI